jgi:hypothetical protein
MTMRSLLLVIVLLLVSPGCVPLPPIPTFPVPATPQDTPTNPFPTETVSPSETSTDTALPPLTESPPSTETETTTSSPEPSPTETATSTLSPTLSPTSSPETLNIPELADWQNPTLAFSHGAEGEWDFILWGGFSNSLIKKGDTYYLYYQGSRYYDEQCESVAQRAIGVATSTDGIHWTKSEQNPIISWSSQGSIEEGAVSAAAWVGEDGRVYLYYGANTGSGCNVNANARLAVSEDGVNFQDLGEVLSGMDPNVWGSGDEIFPIGVYSYQNRWYLYYTPNGVALSRKLGVAIGESPTTFGQTFGLNDSTLPAWGPVSVIVAGPDSVLITNPNDGVTPMSFYRFSADNPSAVQIHDAYTVPNCAQASVIHDTSTASWMMSCRDQNAENYYIWRAITP